MRQATTDDINSIKFILNSYSKKEDLIEAQLKKFYVTDEFMREFGEHVSDKAFSSSPSLTYGMIKAYPDKFHMGYWVESHSMSLEPLMHDEFVKNLVGDRLEGILLLIRSELLTPQLFDKYFNNEKISQSTKAALLNSATFKLDDDLLFNNRDVLESEIFTSNKQKSWNKELIERIFRNRKLCMRFFINGLLKTNDLGFVIRMLNDDTLEFTQSGETWDSELIAALNYIPQKHYAKLIDKIEKYNSNALSYGVIQHLLETNDFLDEEFILERLNVFGNPAISGKTATYARARDYRRVLLALKLNQ